MDRNYLKVAAGAVALGAAAMIIIPFWKSRKARKAPARKPIELLSWENEGGSVPAANLSQQANVSRDRRERSAA